MDAKLKVLHAAAAEAAACQLHVALQDVAQHSAVVFLVTPELDADPHKHALSREALTASAEGRLVLVAVNGAVPPLGLRDLIRHQWTLGANAKELAPIVDAINAATKPSRITESAAAPRALSKRRFLRGWKIGGVAALLAFLLFGSIVTMWNQAPKAPLDTQSQVPRYEDMRDGTVPRRELGLPPPMSPPTPAPTPAPKLAPKASQNTMASLSQEIARLRAVQEDTAQGVQLAIAAIEELKDWLIAGAAIIVLQFGAVFILLFRRAPARKVAQSLPQLRTKTDAPVGPFVFASYSRKDQEKIDQVIGEIEETGIKIWLDRKNIGGGTTWPEEIVRAIRNAQSCVLFCSSQAFESDHVLREVNLADSHKKLLVPIFIEETAVPDSFAYYLSTRQQIDQSKDPAWREKAINVLKATA
jgi:hypothetical protein